MLIRKEKKIPKEDLNKGSGVKNSQFRITKIQEIIFISFTFPMESRLEALLP